MLDRMMAWFSGSGTLAHILFIVLVLVVVHLGVSQIRRAGRRLATASLGRRMAKARTVVSLATSIIVFALYFTGFGLIVKEFGLSLKTYLASASIMGLAIGFGSQGLVQDVVTGITLVFSDLIDVGEMVEISGQTGIVRSIGMRFTTLENSMGAFIYIPNRSIANVINYPRGYVRALLDVTLPADPALAEPAEQRVVAAAQSLHDQVPGIFITPPSVEGRIAAGKARTILRVKFRIWPGRGAPIETVLKAEIVAALKKLDEQYADWMVTVNYEAEKKIARN
jgi:small conductance mechanosensitive channel